MVLIFLHDAQGLFHFAFVVEIHFDVHSVATDIVEKRSQLIEGDPTGHDTLATVKDLTIEVVPFRGTTLRLTHTGCPLNGIQFFDLKECRQMMHGPYPVEMV